MAWYTILFITVISLFVVKLAISLFAGDIDLDVDFDGDSDFDTSSAFSFKGALHFLVGFSSYLFARAHADTVNIVDGPFKGMSGKVDSVDLENSRLNVLIDLFCMGYYCWYYCNDCIILCL